ncbi:MAG: type II toxin-antitoxin system Phd/YefM family antitoxin [Bacillota bacterium]|nr:type II toxin-antitoxin system Phd/YefM family antitoxin [Bacillota bacterium]
MNSNGYNLKQGEEMNISTKAIVSNSDMIKNYKTCREKAEVSGKIFILKNNQPEAVLLSITEYERISAFIEYMESLEEKDVARVIALLPVEGKRKTYSFDHLKLKIDDQPELK